MARPPEPYPRTIERPSFLWTIRWPLGAIAVLLLVFFVLSSTGAVESIDGPDIIDIRKADRARYILTDKETGCEYLDASGTTPRIADDGVTHMGCRKVKRLP